MPKMHFLDILENSVRLDISQISFNLFNLHHDSMPFLSTCIAFYDISARTCAEIKLLSPTSLGFLFFTFIFFRLSFLSFSYLFAVVIDLLLNSLPVEKILREHHPDRQILPWRIHACSRGKFALSFSLKFLSSFDHISDSIESITLIWVSLKRSFPPAGVE